MSRLAASDLSEIVERDRETFCGTRAAVLGWALQSAPQYAHVARSADGLTHYCFGRRGRLFDQIGPIVAGNEEVAQALLRAAFAGAADRAVAVDAFDSSGAFAAGLRGLGFSLERPLFRMRRAARDATATEDAVMRVAGTRSVSEFAIFGPEFA